MQSLIDRRRVMGGGKSLPYDCEIEYLEINEGCESPCIDTGVIIDSLEYDFYLDITYLGYSNDARWISWFAAYTDEDSAAYRIIREAASDNYVRIYWGDPAGNGKGTILVEVGERYNISFEGSKGVMKINEHIKSLFSSLVSPNSNSMIIGKVLPQATNVTYQKIYHCKINKNGKLILDLIPVRKGNEGFMYDKVSGKLFGNSGTGKFILGPNIGKPYDAEVEYLEVNEEGGRAIIDTEYVPNGKDITIECDFMPLGYNTDVKYPTMVYGALTNDNSSCYILIRAESANNMLYIYNSAKGSTGTALPITMNNRYNLISTSNSYTLNGNIVDVKFPSSTNDNINTLKFTSHSVDGSYHGYYRLYSFCLKKGDETILDLIPVRKDGKGYLFNKVDGNLYGNVNDGDGSYFIIGPDKVYKPYDAEVEYLENDKGDYSVTIDTGYVPTGTDNDFFIKGMYLGPKGSDYFKTLIGCSNDMGTTHYSLSKNYPNDIIIVHNGSANGTGKYGLTPSIASNNEFDISVFKDYTIRCNGVQSKYNGVYVNDNKNSLKFWSYEPDVDNDGKNEYPTYLSRIYSFKWVKGDKTILDLIPVRKGNIGYFYDKISGKLLSASTPEALVIGPDIN